jgi:Tol biopolymer transport system component
LFWSPDSRFLAFEAGGKLKKIDIAGGPAQTLCETAGFVVGGAWKPDGVIIFGAVQARGVGGIMRVSANGGSASLVTTIDPSRKEMWHCQPSFLPDGRHFIYFRGSQEPENTGIYVGSLDAKPEEQDLKRLVATHLGAAYVQPSETAMGQLLFVRDGTLLAQPFDASRIEFVGEPVALVKQIGALLTFGFFSVSNNGVLVYRTADEVMQLTWLDQRGKRLGTLGEPGFTNALALSPDGTRAAISRVDVQTAQMTLWLMDLGRGTSTRFTFGTVPILGAVWSPDSGRIFFGLGMGARHDLYQKLASGVKDQELLLESGEGKVPISCSSDGRFLLYGTLDPKTKKRELWILPLEGDKKPFPFVHTPFNNSGGQFSPDGRLVAYVSDESGRDEIYVRTFSPPGRAVGSADDGKWIISTGGGTEPRWSGDKKTLYYVAPDGKLIAVEIAANETFRAGVPKTLFQVPGLFMNPSGQSWGVTPDDKRFLFLLMDRGMATFNVVVNWPAALKK